MYLHKKFEYEFYKFCDTYLFVQKYINNWIPTTRARKKNTNIVYKVFQRNISIKRSPSYPVRLKSYLFAKRSPGTAQASDTKL